MIQLNPFCFLCKFCLIALMGSMAFSSLAQQGPQYTQFMFNNLVINPAYAGTEEALSLTFLSRSQWSGVEKAPATQSFAAHTPVWKKNIGLGITFIRDQIGVHKNTSILTSYAYHIGLSDHTTISMGLQVGYVNYKSDYASLLGVSNDPKLSNSINEGKLDIGTGIFIKSEQLQIGLSAPGLLSHTMKLNDTTSVNIRKLNVLGSARYLFSLGESIEMQPGVIVKFYPDIPVSFDANVNFIYRKVMTTGVSYRSNESIDLILKFQLTPQLELGYAYDYPISYASHLSGASHELMVHYLFRKTQNHVESPR